MEQRKCWNCCYFSRYYTKETTRFMQTELGHCCRRGEMTASNGGCEKFVRRKPRKRSETMLRVCLGDILLQLRAIRQIMEEEERCDEEGE